MFKFIVLVSIITKSILAIDLIIYPNVAQISEQLYINESSISLSLSDYSNAIRDTLIFDGKDLIEQDIYDITKEADHPWVRVNRMSQCDNKGASVCQYTLAKIVTYIDSEKILLQGYLSYTSGPTTGYFYANIHDVEYVQKPHEDETLLIAKFNDNVQKFNLTYLATGISWAPSYYVTVVNNNEGKIKGLANIKNTHSQRYNVEKTSLVGGTVPIANGQGSIDRFRPIMDKGESLIEVTSTGETQGLHTYKIDSNYILYPKSTKSIQFVQNIKIKLNYLLKTIANIGTQGGVQNGLFQRNYEIIPNQFLPAGTISFQQDGTFLGQTVMPNSAMDLVQTIPLGNDYDVRYKMETTITKVDSDKRQDSDLIVTIDNKKR